MKAKAFVIPSIFQAIDKLSPTFKIMGKSADVFTAKLDRIQGVSQKISMQAGLAGAALAAPLVIAAKAAIDFEDKLADVAKTTGLEGSGLKKFGDELLDMSLKTRTSIDDLLKIGEIGGQLGIVEKDLVSFTEATNKFNVALGSDFSGGVEEASSSIGKLRGLFKETRNMSPATAINTIGSAINDLGASGEGTSANITEFTARIGQLPDAIKPSITATQALGTLFEEKSINAEIAARGLSDILLTAASHVGSFAKQMGRSAKEAEHLINTDPTTFVKEFAKSLNGLTAPQLAKKLADLKIGDVGAIKVVGVLSTGVKRLTTLQELASKAFADGTSLTDEYNKKNETTAAKLAIAENNFKALSIVIGTELLPAITEAVGMITPIIKSIIDFTRRNPKLVKTILLVTAAMSGLLLVLSGVAAVVAVATSPVTLIVLAVAAVIAIIATVISYWKEWGAAVVAFFGILFPPFGLFIFFVRSLYNNWQMVVKAFSEKGIAEGILAIGNLLADVVLYPLQKILELIGKITGADWAASAAQGIESFRKDLGINVTEDQGAEDSKEAVNPKAEEQAAMTQRMESVQKNQVEIGINAPKGAAEIKKNSGGIPVKLTSTQSYDQ